MCHNSIFPYGEFFKTTKATLLAVGTNSVRLLESSTRDLNSIFRERKSYGGEGEGGEECVCVCVCVCPDGK